MHVELTYFHDWIKGGAYFEIFKKSKLFSYEVSLKSQK